jgi:hypothetical protein
MSRAASAQDANAWDPIDVVTFADGLGRIIQTKKDLVAEWCVL